MRTPLPSFPTAAPFVIVAALTGCATPSPLVRLYPRSPDVVWAAGRASVTREQAGVRVAAAFDHQDGPNLGMRVEVENGTEGKLEIDPHEFTFNTCRGPEISSCGIPQRIIDPEGVLLALDERQSREQANAANSQALLGTLVILNAVGDVASVASGHADAHTGEGTVAAAALMQADAVARDSSQSSIASQHAMWSNEALRRNTLFPGRGTGGRVYIPIDLQAQIVWFHVRLNGQVFSFPFQQTVTRLSQPRAPAPAHWGGDQ
jgi:hypothetical protein